MAQPSTATDRVVRVFISSTFRDMFKERDILVKRIFPQLRKLCEERFVTWGEVDLRWGVPDEKKAEGKVLPICLEEIRRCRPYFIGLLGARYGSLPEELPQDLLEREPWLKEHQKHSLTELEIWHGVLNDPKMAGRSFFYFRDPAYLSHLPDGADPADFAAESPEAAEKLSGLKERIRASGLPVRENYATPEELGDSVLRDLTKVINELYPPGSEPRPLDREAQLHYAFALSRARVYIGRDEYFKRLDDHATGDGPPLIILGASGSGKSALLANWALKYRDEHKEELLILHFIGASPASSDWAAMLRRILGEFKRSFGFREEIPDKPDALRSTFANWLHMASAKGKVILLIDALNQLEDRDGALDLVWLPPVIPPNVRLILSTLPGRPLDDLQKRKWPTLTIRPFNADERAQFIENYLKLYTKELSPAHASRIAAAKQTENPLFLQALLEELRLFGRHEELERRISLYLGAPDIIALYELILARYEEDYEGDRPGLVRDSMTAIWAARRGLSEAELLDILGKEGEPLARALWSPLLLAAEHTVASRSGLVFLSEDSLRQAVHRKYLRTRDEEGVVHRLLADYFEWHSADARRRDEFPWQLAKAGAWQRLASALADLNLFDALWQTQSLDVRAYWATLESKSYGMGDVYQTVLASLESVKRDEQLWHLAALFYESGYAENAMVIWSYLARRCRKARDRRGLRTALNNQGAVLHARRDFDAALTQYTEVKKLCAGARGRVDLQLCLGNMATVLLDMGRADEAMRCLSQQEHICRGLSDRGSLARCLGKQATILSEGGQPVRARQLLVQQERIYREAGDIVGLAQSFGLTATILLFQGFHREAVGYLRQQEQICRRVGDGVGLSLALCNEAVALSHSRGRLSEALGLAHESYELASSRGQIALAEKIARVVRKIEALLR